MMAKKIKAPITPLTEKEKHLNKIELSRIPQKNRIAHLKKNFSKEKHEPINIESLLSIFSTSPRARDVKKRIYLSGHGSYDTQFFMKKRKLKTGNAEIAQLNYDQYKQLLDLLSIINCEFLYIDSCYSSGWNQVTMNMIQDKVNTNILKERDIPFAITITSGPDATSEVFILAPIKFKLFFAKLHTFLDKELKQKGGWKGWLKQKPWLYLKPFKDILQPITYDTPEKISSIRLPGTDFFRAIALSDTTEIITYPNLLKHEIEAEGRKRKLLKKIEKKLNNIKKGKLGKEAKQLEKVIIELEKHQEKSPEDEFTIKMLEKKIQSITKKDKQLIRFKNLLETQIDLKQPTNYYISEKIDLILLYPSIIEMPLIIESDDARILSLIPGPSHHYIDKMTLRTPSQTDLLSFITKFGNPQKDVAPRLFFFGKASFINHSPIDKNYTLFPFELKKGETLKLKNLAIKIYPSWLKKEPKYICQSGWQYYYAKRKPDRALSIMFKQISRVDALSEINTWIEETVPDKVALRKATIVETEKKFKKTIKRSLEKQPITKEHLTYKKKQELLEKLIRRIEADEYGLELELDNLIRSLEHLRNFFIFLKVDLSKELLKIKRENEKFSNVRNAMKKILNTSVIDESIKMAKKTGQELDEYIMQIKQKDIESYVYNEVRKISSAMIQFIIRRLTSLRLFSENTSKSTSWKNLCQSFSIFAQQTEKELITWESLRKKLPPAQKYGFIPTVNRLLSLPSMKILLRIKRLTCALAE
jgi:hypothetical protein